VLYNIFNFIYLSIYGSDDGAFVVKALNKTQSADLRQRYGSGDGVLIVVL